MTGYRPLRSTECRWQSGHTDCPGYYVTNKRDNVQSACKCACHSPEESAELFARRKRIGLSQMGLAAILGVAEVTVWRWEHNQRRVPGYVHLVLDTLEENPENMVTSLAWLAKLREGSGT